MLGSCFFVLDLLMDQSGVDSLTFYKKEVGYAKIDEYAKERG